MLFNYQILKKHYRQGCFNRSVSAAISLQYFIALFARKSNWCSLRWLLPLYLQSAAIYSAKPFYEALTYRNRRKHLCFQKHPNQAFQKRTIHVGKRIYLQSNFFWGRTVAYDHFRFHSRFKSTVRFYRSALFFQAI